MEILRMMHLTIRSKFIDNTLIKSVVSFLKSKPYATPSLLEFISYLTELVPVKYPQKIIKTKCSPGKLQRFTTRNRYSIEQTESSLEKSLRFIRSNRKKTIDVIAESSRRNRYKLGKFSLF